MASINNLRHTKVEITCLFLSVVLVCFFAVLAAIANTDLTAGRFALFMDERITFDGVHQILHPDGLKHFIWSVLDGGDHRYGRSLWNSMAIFSVMPEFFFGEKGQIVAGRMTQVVILLAAFILLTVTFVRHWTLRFLLLAFLLAMPYTEYFMTIPKPEPLQMLFIAFFLFFFKKNEMMLRGWYWIFLGLAFGTKISTLPIIGIFLFATYIKYSLEADRDRFNIEMVGTLGYFLLGLAIAVPVLAPNIAISIILFNLINKYLTSHYALRHWLINIFTIAFLAVANLAIAGTLFFKFHIITGLAVWGGSTFLNTTHGSDSSSVGIGSWFNFFLNDWMIAPVFATVVLFLICLILVIRLITQYSGPDSFRSMPFYSIPLVVMFSGLVLNLSVFVTVHRLWGHYLSPGAILIIVGMFAIFESYMFHAGAWSKDHKNAKPEQYIALLGLLLVASITFIWWFPHCIAEYEKLANRTNNVKYTEQYKSYSEITAFLDDYADKKKTRLMVSFDPALFIPQSNERYQITEFWGPYKNWEKNPDVIILGKDHTERRVLIQKESPNYDAHIRERDGYNMYVINKGTVCLREKCYHRVLELANGGEILVLILPKIGG